MRSTSPTILAALALTLTAAPLAARRAQATQEPEAVAQEALPEARTIIDKFLRASGRTEELEKIQSIHTIGTIEILGMGIKGPTESFQARPNLSVSRSTLEGIGEINTGFDGKVAWLEQAMMGPMLIDGFPCEQLKSQSTFNAQVYDPELYEVVETVARTAYEGSDCYKVRFVTKPYESEDSEISDPEKSLPYRESFQYFDAESELLVGTSVLVASFMGDMPTTTVVSEYKKFGDFLFATKAIQKQAGMEVLITTSAVEFDNVPKEAFDLPPSIRALLRDDEPGDK